VTAVPLVRVLRPDTSRDRLELLTALISSPSFDPLLRPDVIRIPRGHRVYRWECVVAGCERPRSSGIDFCSVHRVQWRLAAGRGTCKAEFVTRAQPLEASQGPEQVPCRVCMQRPATHTRWRLCRRHMNGWRAHRASGGDAAQFGQWLAGQEPFSGYGACQVVVCPGLASSPLGLCPGHEAGYRRDGMPGRRLLPPQWFPRFEQHDLRVPVTCADPRRFGEWCATATAMPWPGQVSLLGLRPLARAEIRWGMSCHAARQRHSQWQLWWVQSLVNACREQDAGSLADLSLDACTEAVSAVAREMLNDLRLIYFTPAGSRDAGFLETAHFGVGFRDRGGHFDLTGVSQRWLRDLLWDYLADLLRSPRCPRTAGPLDNARRSAAELSAFLDVQAPGGGHDPAVLRAGHIQDFAADQRHRERHGMTSLAMKRSDGTPSLITANTRSIVIGTARTLLRYALDTGQAEQIRLGREVITAMPAPGRTPQRARSPFRDEAARALADEDSLAQLAAAYDPGDHGARDIWETIIITGRRASEVIRLRLECTGRYGGLAMLWHDQTKVGKLDEAIRIPERLYLLLQKRQHTTLTRFAAEHGRWPGASQRPAMALFPSARRNPDGTASLSYTWFRSAFRPWVDQLDLGHCVPHQARHTLATSLLRAGATLTHVRRYLGHVSDRMAEHYIQLAHSDLEDVLQHVWVAGPGAAAPGELICGSTEPLTREQAQALAVDLSRRSTPAEGGFCTFQPVVDGGTCPWNLDCHNCGSFVLSGADLLYWRRKREQWYSLAERAPDEATAAWLHQVFAPAAAAIDGLEAALAGLGLLDEALALDLRRPQDYFQRIWATGFRAAELAKATAEADAVAGDQADGSCDETEATA
jgi:integrase